MSASTQAPFSFNPVLYRQWLQTLLPPSRPWTSNRPSSELVSFLLDLLGKHVNINCYFKLYQVIPLSGRAVFSFSESVFFELGGRWSFSLGEGGRDSLGVKGRNVILIKPKKEGDHGKKSEVCRETNSTCHYLGRGNPCLPAWYQKRKCTVRPCTCK